MNIKNTDSLKLSTENTILLVIDKQNGYVNRQPDDGGNDLLLAALPRIDKFIVESREFGLPIIWTQMTENRQESPEVIKKVMLSDPLTKDRTIKNEESYEICGEKPFVSELVIHKKYYNAFANTDLDKELSDKKITNIIIIGAYGSRCVLGTAFGANSNDYNVLVLEDLIANPDNSAAEIQPTINIVDNILGWTLNSSDVFSIIKKP